MRLHRSVRALAGGLAILTLCLTPSALAQSAEADYYKAYYLQHEKGKLETALDLYQGVARSKGADASLRKRAKAAAQEIAEDLAAADFTRLMPEETIFYLEINHPGDQLGALADQLGLLGVAKDGRSFGISPHLLEGALDLRGAAMAITAIDPNGGPPEGVLVLHPGGQKTVRGLLETGLPAGGQPVESIAGMPTWQVEGEAYVTLTSRLLVAGSSRAHVEGVIARMKGGKRLRSLAGAESLASARSLRGDDLIFFHLNAKPILPMLRMAMEQQARHDPEVAMAMAFLDIDSLKGFTGRIGVDDAGVGLDLALQLDEGHQNLFFNLMRTPTLDVNTLKVVPSGAAFFFATSFNESSCVAPPSGDPDRPIVTAMDFGREVFGNLVDVVVYGMPARDGNAGGMPIPDIVMCLRVNDVDRSRALWNFVLGLASQSSGGGSMHADVVEIAGIDCERYQVQGVPVYLVTREKEMILSASRHAIAQTLKARQRGDYILEDEMFGDSLRKMGADNTTALLLNAGRCAQMMRPFLSERERKEMEPVAQILAETVFSVGFQQGNESLALHARIEKLPDLSPVVAMLMHERRHRAPVGFEYAAAEAHRAPIQEAGANEAPDVADLEDLQDSFYQLAAAGERKEAMRTGELILELMSDDAMGLNNFAWALLTEDPFQGQYSKLARKMSRVSNDLTGFGDWAALDTLALAEFECGNVQKAVELEKKALDLAQGTGREAEIEVNLEKFLKGIEEAKKSKEKKKGVGVH